MQITKHDDIITIDGIDFKQSKSWPNYYVSKLGSYITDTRFGISNIRYGTKAYNKKGYLLQCQVCVWRSCNGSASKVVNLGRLVLDAWEIEQTYDDEGVLRTEVDHINRDPSDNRLENLRWATRKENCANRRKFKIKPTWLKDPAVIAKRKETCRLKRLSRCTNTI